MLAVDSGLSPFVEMGLTVSKQTNTHLASQLSGNTSKNEISILHLSHLSGLLLQSLCCCLLRVVIALSDLETLLLFKLFLPLQSPARATSLTGSLPLVAGAASACRAMRPIRSTDCQVPQSEKVPL